MDMGGSLQDGAALVNYCLLLPTAAQSAKPPSMGESVERVWHFAGDENVNLMIEAHRERLSKQRGGAKVSSSDAIRDMIRRFKVRS